MSQPSPIGASGAGSSDGAAGILGNEADLRELLDLLDDDPETDAPEISEFLGLLAGIGRVKGLKAEEHQAAVLLGRGCPTSQIQELTGVNPSRLALLGENPVFLEKVSRQRLAWANEELSRLQRSISGLTPTTIGQAVSLWRVIGDVLAKRHALEKARVELGLKVQEARDRPPLEPTPKKARVLALKEVPEDVDLEGEAATVVGKWEAWEGEAGSEVDDEDLEPALP